MKAKPAPHPTLPKIFVAGQKLRVYFDYLSVSGSHAAAFRNAFNNSLAELRKLDIFSEIASVLDSKNCDIFVTFAAIKADFGNGDIIGEARFRYHESKKTYVQIKLDPRANWSFSEPKWFWQRFLNKTERVERWLNHELLHALGCSHTTEKKSPMPSILDENNWSDRRTDIPEWDRDYARSLYNLPISKRHQL